MTNRIDHAAEAVGLLALAAAGVRDRRYLIAAAHIHATLAVAEQARIANLIALAKLAGHSGPDEVAVLRPDIAAALGIEAVDHD